MIAFMTLQSLLGHSICAISTSSFASSDSESISLGAFSLRLSHISQLLSMARLSNSHTVQRHFSKLADLGILFFYITIYYAAQLAKTYNAFI